nr:hypothetical transcript [Hymenolepis microstoma]
MPIPTTRKLPFSHNLPFFHLTLFCPLGQFFPHFLAHLHTHLNQTPLVPLVIPIAPKYTYPCQFQQQGNFHSATIFHYLILPYFAHLANSFPIFSPIANSNNKETSIQPQSSIHANSNNKETSIQPQSSILSPTTRKLPFSHNLPFFHLSNNKETSIQPQSSILSSYPILPTWLLHPNTPIHANSNNKETSIQPQSSILSSYPILPTWPILAPFSRPSPHDHLANSFPIFSPISTPTYAHMANSCPIFSPISTPPYFAHLANSCPIFSPISTPTSTKHH